MVICNVDLTEEGAERMAWLSQVLGTTPSGVVRRAFDFFEEVVGEIREGRVIAATPQDRTFHDWNFGTYHQANAHKILMK